MNGNCLLLLLLRPLLWVCSPPGELGLFHGLVRGKVSLMQALSPVISLCSLGWGTLCTNWLAEDSHEFCHYVNDSDNIKFNLFANIKCTDQKMYHDLSILLKFGLSVPRRILYTEHLVVTTDGFYLCPLHTTAI